jgi:hypothetical protein
MELRGFSLKQPGSLAPSLNEQMSSIAKAYEVRLPAEEMNYGEPG